MPIAGYDYVATQDLRINNVRAFVTGQLVPDSTASAQGWIASGLVVPVGSAMPGATGNVPISPVAPDPLVQPTWADSSTAPPTLKGWSGTAWVAYTSGGGGAVASVNGHTGTVVLAASDVGAQPVDTDLTSIAALGTTTFGRGLLTQTDATALRGTAGLGTAAVVNTGTASGNVPLLGASGTLPVARLATGTPDGTKFIRDDGTLVTPAGTGSGVTSFNARTGVVVPATSDYTADQIADGTTNRLYTATEKTKLAAITGTNTGDETATTIKSKLSITTLSGSNTGDQTLPTTLPPNGTASGDLSGTYPSPTVAKVNGVAVTGTPSVGWVPTATSGTAATWQAPSGGGSSPLLACTQYAPSTDVTYTTVSASLVVIDATHLTTGSFVAPTSGQVLVRLTGVPYNAAGSIYWGLRDHAGAKAQRGYVMLVTSSGIQAVLTVAQLVTGLTSGSSYQFDWAWVAGGGTVQMDVQGAATASTGAPAVMEVWSA